MVHDGGGITLKSPIFSEFKTSVFRLSSQIFSLQKQPVLKSNFLTFKILSVFQLLSSQRPISSGFPKTRLPHPPPIQLIVVFIYTTNLATICCCIICCHSCLDFLVFFIFGFIVSLCVRRVSLSSVRSRVGSSCVA